MKMTTLTLITSKLRAYKVPINIYSPAFKHIIYYNITFKEFCTWHGFLDEFPVHQFMVVYLITTPRLVRPDTTGI